MSLSHEPYITAVIDALTAAGLGPTTWWMSDAEIDPRGDGATTMDNAILIWGGDHPAVNTGEHPHGALFTWESSADAWQWAAFRDDGSNDELESLELPLDAAPERVFDVARRVLSASGETPKAVTV